MPKARRKEAMLDAITKRINSAHVLGVIAIVLALGGSAVAAKITTQKLAKNAVTAPKIANEAVKKLKIKDGAVGAAKFGRTTIRTATETLPAGAGFAAPKGAEKEVKCLAGEKLLGGGADITDLAGADDPVTVAASAPTTDGLGWKARGLNGAAAARTLKVHAVCLAQ